MPLDPNPLRVPPSREIAKTLRAGALEAAMAARPQLVMNIGRLPPGVAPTRDVLAHVLVDCRGDCVVGTVCLRCPRLVFWMVAPERDRLKLFCRRP
jgi:hypothetical protein